MSLPVLTIVVRPVDARQPDPMRTPVEVYAILEDETVFPRTLFPNLASFADYALNAGWKMRFKCIAITWDQRMKELP